jgi:hypothetical protein
MSGFKISYDPVKAGRLITAAPAEHKPLNIVDLIAFLRLKTPFKQVKSGFFSINSQNINLLESFKSLYLVLLKLLYLQRELLA